MAAAERRRADKAEAERQSALGQLREAKAASEALTLRVKAEVHRTVQRDEELHREKTEVIRIAHAEQLQFTELNVYALRSNIARDMSLVHEAKVRDYQKDVEEEARRLREELEVRAAERLEYRETLLRGEAPSSLCMQRRHMELVDHELHA